MILANPSPDAARAGQKKNNGSTVRLPIPDGELCLPNSCLRPFRKLAKSDPQRAFAGILPEEDWNGETKKVVEHSNDPAKFRYMAAARAYLGLLSRLEARKQEWQNELQQAKSEETCILGATATVGERIKQLEKVFSEAQAALEEISQKEELGRKTADFRAKVDEVAEKKGVKELIDSLEKTLSSVLGPGDRISIKDYSSLTVELASKGSSGLQEGGSAAAIDAAYQTTMKFISKMNDYVEVVQDSAQLASVVEAADHIQNLKDVLEKYSARSDWLEPMLLRGRLSTPLADAEIAKILKVLEKQSKSANEDVLMGLQSVKQFSDLAGTCSKGLAKVRKERQQLEKYINGLESNPSDKRMWLEDMGYRGTLEYCINRLREYKNDEERLSVSLATINDARNLISFLVTSQKTALRAAGAMLDTAARLASEREGLSALSEKLCALSERKTHRERLPGLEAAIARVKEKLEGLQSELGTMLQKEKLGKMLREERQKNRDISSRKRFFELELVADAQPKTQAFAFTAPAKPAEVMEDKATAQKQKIDDFIGKGAAHSDFSKAFGVSPQTARRFKELLERLAGAYVKNGGKLHREAVSREFPQLVRDEGDRHGFEGDVHIIRLGFDYRAKWRLFMNIKNPECPIIMFVGPKHGKNGSDSYLDNKKYFYDDIKAREDGRAGWFPALLENGVESHKNSGNGGK